MSVVLNIFLNFVSIRDIAEYYIVEKYRNEINLPGQLLTDLISNR